MQKALEAWWLLFTYIQVQYAWHFAAQISVKMVAAGGSDAVILDNSLSLCSPLHKELNYVQCLNIHQVLLLLDVSEVHQEFLWPLSCLSAVTLSHTHW